MLKKSQGQKDEWEKRYTSYAISQTTQGLQQFSQEPGHTTYTQEHTGTWVPPPEETANYIILTGLTKCTVSLHTKACSEKVRLPGTPPGLSG